MRLRIILAMVLVLLFGSLTKAQDFYISPSGSDSNSGTSIGSPWQHLSKATSSAVTTLAASQKVVVAVRGNAGAFYGQDGAGATWAISGVTPANTITFETNPGDSQAALTGGKTITGFTNVAGVWQVNLPTSPATVDFSQVWAVDGSRRWRARSSGYLLNAGAVYVACTGPGCPSTNNVPGCPVLVTSTGLFLCYDRCTFSGTDIQNWADLSTHKVEWIDFEQWDLSRMYIDHITTSPNQVFFTGNMQTDPSPLANPNAQNHGCIPGHRYMIENEQALLSPGEFYIDESGSPWVLHYMPMGGENISGYTLTYPQTVTLLTVTSSANLVFSNLAFGEENWTTPAGGYKSQQNDPDLPAAIQVHTSNHITFTGDVIRHIGEWGGEFQGSTSGTGYGNNVLTGSVIYDIGDGGWRVGNNDKGGETNLSVEQNDTVTQNLVVGNGRMLGNGPGLYVGNSHDDLVSHNDVFYTYHDGISIGFAFPPACPGGAGSFTNNVTVSYNHVAHVMQGVLSDTGAVYEALGCANFGDVIDHNLLTDISNDPRSYSSGPGYGGHAIYLDVVSGNVSVTNNISLRATDTLFRCSWCMAVSVTNDIWAFSKNAIAIRGKAPGTLIDNLSYTMTRNIFLLGSASIAQPQDPTGGWLCSNSVTHVWLTGGCHDRFALNSNLYWNVDGTKPTFITSIPSVSYLGLGGNVCSPISWQCTNTVTANGPNEDLTSIIQNPQFVAPYVSLDNFTVPPSSPAVTLLGFVPIDISTAGRQSPTLFSIPPTVLDAYPLQLPASGAFGQAVSPAQVGNLRILVLP